ncbi:MAG TPA: GAF domain-containing protein [Aggregatilineales bacterium]|nr:GAF domain-containing protein [Aggregatilineales bacterium]
MSSQDINNVTSDAHQTIDMVLDGLNQLEIRLNKFQPTLAALGMSLNIKDTMDMLRQMLEKVKIQNKRTKDSLLQLQNIVRSSATITSSLELDHVLDQVIDTVIALTGAERAYLMLRDAQTDELIPRTARNWDRQKIDQGDVMISTKVINLALAQKEPILTTNAQQDTRFGDSESVIRYALRSILCVPLMLHGNLVGVLYADNRIVRGAFSPSHIPLLSAFGTQAAVAIENARMFEQTRADLDKTRRELETLRSHVGASQLATNGKETASPPTQPAAPSVVSTTPAADPKA